MADDYRAGFRRTLASQPLRHAARLAEFQLRKLHPRRFSDERALRHAVANGASVVSTSAQLRPPAHYYQGYRGPWIEDYFFRYWMRERSRTALRYLPIFWTDLYLHAQTHRFSPTRQQSIATEIRDLLDCRLAADQAYFTVLEYDHMIWDWHLFPRHVVVFSAGGWGDVPLPLLKGSPPFACPPKDIPLSFVGRVGGASDATGVRGKMHAALRNHALFSEGPGWREIMARSTFSLCPRGLGRASFRLYEALSVGSIPIYLWDDCEWLPYRDRLDWSEIAISLPIDRVAELPVVLAQFPPARIERMRRRIAEVYDDYFTLPGMCRQIMFDVKRLADRTRLFELMQARPYPPGTTNVPAIPDFFCRA